MSQRNLMILLVGTIISYVCHVRGEKNPYARYVATGLTAIQDGALEQAPNRELLNGAMQGMVEVLQQRGDEHSQFLDESQAEPLKAEIHQQFGGIGVRIQFVGDPPRLMIIGPPDPGTPAARANLLPGDQILAIDNHPTADMTMADVLRRIRGRPDESIRLTVRQKHSQNVEEFELVREIIHLESVLGDIRRPDGTWQFRLDQDPRLALVRLTSFGDRTMEELEKTLESLREDGIQAVVLDLRDNAGGSLDVAVAVCELLLPPGRIVVETRGRNQQLRERFMTTRNGDFRDLPLVVLVNQNSASAAEIVAACLQDHGRAAIAGQRSYGKGTVQQLVPLESGQSLLKLTSASFWRPSGVDIHRRPDAPENGDWGVKPEPGLDLPLSAEEYPAYRRYRNDRDTHDDTAPIDPKEGARSSNEDPLTDRQLEKAIEYLQGKIESPHAASPLR